MENFTTLFTTTEVMDELIVRNHSSNNHSVCDNLSSGKASRDFSDVSTVLDSVVVPIVCSAGILGNILNVFVLCHKHHHKDRMERAASVGLVALAMSDMLCCITVLPHAWTSKGFAFYSFSFSLFYRLYKEAVINTFILCSTWLTVTMATSRYLAICHPLRARQIIGLRFVYSGICMVFCLCVLINIPRYFYYTHQEAYMCQNGVPIYVVHAGYMTKNSALYMVYTVGYTVLSFFIPIVLLSYCNIKLIRTLRKSDRMWNQFRSKFQGSDSVGHVITLTLVGIIIMYTVLMAPGEILIFIKYTCSIPRKKLDLPIKFTNVAQALNFAANFVLYCTINVYFRRTVHGWFCRCRLLRDSSAVVDYESSGFLFSSARSANTSYFVASWPGGAKAKTAVSSGRRHPRDIFCHNNGSYKHVGGHGSTRMTTQC